MSKPNYDEAVKIVDKVYNTTDFTKEQLQPLNEYLDYALGLETQHEAFKKDVARYFEIGIKHRKSLDELREFWVLEEKLQKVGKEE